MRRIRLYVPMLLLLMLPLTGCAIFQKPPSPAMVRVGAKFTTYQTLKLTKASRETSQKTRKIALAFELKLNTDGTVNEAELDAYLDGEIAKEFPDEGTQDAIKIIKDFAKAVIKDAIEKNGFADRVKLTIVYGKATAGGVADGTIQYEVYLDSQ